MAPPPVSYTERFAAAQAALEARQRSRRRGAEISARSLRRDRQRVQSLEWHPAVQPVQQEPSFQPAGMLGPSAPQTPADPSDPWTDFQTCPSYGGRSGRHMSSMARYKAGLMQVRFASGGRGTPNTYQYSGIDPETWKAFMSGRWGEAGTATAWFLTSWGGVRV